MEVQAQLHRELRVVPFVIVLDLFVSRLLEHAWGNAAVARFVYSPNIIFLKDVFQCSAQPEDT